MFRLQILPLVLLLGTAPTAQALCLADCVGTVPRDRAAGACHDTAGAAVKAVLPEDCALGSLGDATLRESSGAPAAPQALPVGTPALALRELAAHHATLAGGAPSAAPDKGAKYQAGAGAREPEADDMAALANKPSTPEKHRALQDYFETFAGRYADQAAGHAAMAAHYRTTGRLAPVANHCDRLVEQLRAIEAEARQAAAMHGALATRR